MNIQLFEQIKNVGSTNKKQEFISQMDDTDRKFVKLALDPMITFGVTVDEDDFINTITWPIASSSTDIAGWWQSYSELLNKFAVRELTGNLAWSSLVELMGIAPNQQCARWGCRVLNKDLRSGFGITLFNKVFPNSIELFAVALAKPFDPSKHDTRGKWILEPKLDGLRCTIVEGVPYTRNGHKIPGIEHVLAEIGNDTLERFVFDGELIGAADFDEGSGLIRRHGSEGKSNIVLNVFDMVRIEEWKKQSTRPLVDRKYDLMELRETEHVVKVDFVTINNPTIQTLFKFRDDFISEGFEGAMMKDAMAPYVFDRSDTLLKLKRFETVDCKIVGTQEGKGKLKGCLGAILVDVSGVESRCGSGFDDETRTTLWSVKDSLIGKTVEVQYQNKSKDGALRFPVFIRMRPDKD